MEKTKAELKVEIDKLGKECRSLNDKKMELTREVQSIESLKNEIEATVSKEKERLTETMNVISDEKLAWNKQKADEKSEIESKKNEVKSILEKEKSLNKKEQDLNEKKDDIETKIKENKKLELDIERSKTEAISKAKEYEWNIGLLEKEKEDFLKEKQNFKENIKDSFNKFLEDINTL